MTTIKIYDPAMCCSTGVCGPNVNETLVQLASFLKNLNETDFKVERYNLSQEPDAYATNEVVAQMLKDKGTDALPITFIDDKVVASGDYLPMDELAKMLGVTQPEKDSGSSCCCSGGTC